MPATRGGKRKASAVITPPRQQGKSSKKQDDDASADTIMAENTSPISHKYTTYLKLAAEVGPSKKGTDTLRSKYGEILATLRECDESSAFAPYKQDIAKDASGNTISSASEIIASPSAIPASITAMGKYFSGTRPNSDGGTVWCQVRLVHNETIDNILADTRDDLKEQSSFFSIQTIQHWEVASLGFLKNLHWDIDVSALTEYFNKHLRRLNKSEVITLGMKVRTPYDGLKTNKKENVKKTPYRERCQAIHVECKASHKDLANKHIKTILESTSFKRRYTVTVRLIPPLDRRDSPYTQDKIRKCITQHNQFCKCISSMTCQGIEHLDQMNTKLKRTLRELIVSLPDAHFINVDLNWTGDSYAILFPTKYEAEARDKIAHLGPYLHKGYGDDILPSLPSDTQAVIYSTIWDDKTGRPSSKLDVELDRILDEDDGIDFVDLTLFEETTTPTSPPTISTTFQPKLDDTSVSTFGQPTTSPKRTAAVSLDAEASIMSEVTIESRVSKMETGLGNMEKLLEQILLNQTHNRFSTNGSAKPDASNSTTAGSMNVDPAAKA